MPARRCNIGCESWPDEPVFTTCVHCGEATRRIGNIEPSISREEARDLKLHELFEKFYERRCAVIGIPSDGPLPDDYEIPGEGPLDLDPLSPL